MKAEDRSFFESLGVDFTQGIGEDYNIFAFEQGILIAEKLQTKENILEFKDKSFDEQMIMVPGLSDGHSGNTFGMAIRAAIAYLPQLIVNKRDIKIDNIIED
jgi:hypothetical protein